MNAANKLILGTVQFGLNYGISNTQGQTSREEAFSILNLAISNGLGVLDTAYSYGDALEVIGQFHKQTDFRFKINSKFKTEKGVSASEQLSITLDKLSIETIDTFFYHRFSDMQSGENREELNILKSKKLITKIGVSIYNNEEFSLAIENEDIDVIQIPFNLFDNFSQRGTLIRKANDRKKNIQTRSVFLQGLFFMNEASLPVKLKILYPYIEEIRSIAFDSKLSVEELALAYALSQPGIHNVLMGVNTSLQLRTNLKSGKHILSPIILERINQIHVQEPDLLNPQYWS